MLTDQQKTDVRRYCGYPVYGASSSGNMGWRFYTAYGQLEYRIGNLSDPETNVIANYLMTLNQLEGAVPSASSNLDSEAAAGWTHNSAEVRDRLHLLDEWRRRLCSFLGIPPGEGLAGPGLHWVV